MSLHSHSIQWQIDLDVLSFCYVEKFYGGDIENPFYSVKNPPKRSDTGETSSVIQ